MISLTNASSSVHVFRRNYKKSFEHSFRGHVRHSFVYLFTRLSKSSDLQVHIGKAIVFLHIGTCPIGPTSGECGADIFQTETMAEDSRLHHLHPAQ